MGSWWDADSVVAFARALPETCLLVLDEAYGETAPAGTIPSIASLIDMPNVIRTRTFSKAYGLAGARVGYVISTPGTAQAFDKIRNHFGMNRIGTAAALAALADSDYLTEVLAKSPLRATGSRQSPARTGLSPCRRRRISSPSIADAMPCFARAIVDRLMDDHGVFIRMPGVAPLNRCIRISTGPEADMALLEEALPKVLDRWRIAWQAIDSRAHLRRSRLPIA